MLFLSYAEEDGNTAREIAQWLDEHGIEVWNWQDPRRRGRQFITEIENAIKDADAFLALLSPSFLTSDWCRRERNVALQREQNLQRGDPRRVFIHVGQIRDTPNSDAGFLGSYDWADLTAPANRDVALLELASRLGLGSEPGRPTPEEMDSDLAPPLFRNREDELEKVLRGLTSASGPHFWLVIGPPQLGKTWFLRRVIADTALSAPADWVTRLVDVRAQSPAVRGDAAALLALLFGLAAPMTVEPRTLRGIAQGISRSGKPHLCLLDSAELLDKETAATLRSCLGQIYRLVQDASKIGVRLALIVASRRDDDWRGVTPYPRLSPLSLTEFKPDVVQQALDDLAVEMKRSFSSAELRKYAALVHGLTEGLPAVLMRSLQWIRAEEWVGMGRMESQELFEELADRYIRDELLSPQSLVPWTEVQSGSRGGGRAGSPQHALEEAFRVLAPYRLFTQSHLRHYIGPDRAFEESLEAVGWSMGELWRAISGTALLLRPLNEPWQEIHAAIRRLLYRYHYTSDENRAAAHSAARKFVEVWADRQSGKEQVVGLVECIWHEAVVLRLREPAEMEQRLSGSARTLSQTLRPSSAYTLDELRDYASERMRNDEELQAAVDNVDGLFSRLVEIVVAPEQES